MNQQIEKLQRECEDNEAKLQRYERKKEQLDHGCVATNAKTGNVKQFAADFNYLMQCCITTIDELEQYAVNAITKISTLVASIREKTTRISELKELLRHTGNYKEYKPIVDELNRIKFKGKREKYQADYERELDAFYMAKRILKEKVPDNRLTPTAWQKEMDGLISACKQEKNGLRAAYDEMKAVIKIVSYVQEGQRKLEADRSGHKRSQ